MRPSTTPFVSLALFTASVIFAAPPQSPVILEPNTDGAVVSPFDVHMAIEEKFTDADGDKLASTDWEIQRASDRALQWSAYAISDLRIWHVHFGDGTFANAGRTALDAQTNYLLRVRMRDSSGEASAWTERPFTTGRLEDIFPLQLTDIEASPLPAWVDSATAAQILLQPATTPHELRLESCCGELFYRNRGPSLSSTFVTENFPAIAQDKPLRVTLIAGSTNLILPTSRISFTDGRLVNRNVYLPRVNLSPGQQVSFWISITGSSYADESGTDIPTFGELAQGAPVSWITEQPGYVAEIVSTGYQLPTAICFVPHPSGDPTAPKYYIGELYGKIKVVANNGEVSDFATGLLNYTPDPSFPGSGEMGIADIAVHPQSGHIFASMVYRQGGNFYGAIYRLPSTDGGRTMTAPLERIFSTFPYTTGPSHQVSNISFDQDGHLFVHTGDGFLASAALDLNDPRGKILRMDTSGQPLPSNPFYDTRNGISFTDFIFSYGYRNPFGGEWRSEDGALYVVENGTNANDRLSRADAGQSYGWNGNDTSMTIRAIHNWIIPVAPVQMTFIQSSVFGGSGFPSSAWGQAYVTESGPTYATGPQANGKRITSFTLGPSGEKLSGPDVLASYQGSGRSTAAAITAGPDGLYFSDLYKESGNNPSAAGANILRIRFVGAADFTLRNNTGAPPLRVAFTDTSTVPEPASWLWDFGDGTTSNERNPTHTYTRAGSFTVRLTVTGPDGAAVASKPAAVIVGDKKHVLMVTGASSLNAAEEYIRQRLVAKNYEISHAADSSVTTADGENKSLILISSSVLSANVGSKFRLSEVPVLCYESHLFDDLGLTGPVSGTDYGTRTGQTQLLLFADPEDPLVRDLPVGLQNTTTTPMIYTWGRPIEGAKISALLAGTAEAGIFRFETGSALDGGLIAPARRLGLMLEDLTAEALTATGWALVERAVDWTSNLAPQVSIPSPDSGSKFRRSDQLVITTQSADLDGTILRVDYFANDALIGSTTALPHELLWRPAGSGSYAITAQAHDDQGGSSFSEPVHVEILRPFDFWKEQYFNAPQLQDPKVGGFQADPDLDGIANLLEYALGSSPWRFDPPPTRTGLEQVDGELFPSITYQISQYADVSVAPEFATDLLGPWINEPSSILVESLRAGDGYTELRARTINPLSAFDGRVFMRLRAHLADSP